MTIDEILDMMDDMLDRAWNLPLTGGGASWTQKSCGR